MTPLKKISSAIIGLGELKWSGYIGSISAIFDNGDIFFDFQTDFLNTKAASPERNKYQNFDEKGRLACSCWQPQG